MLECYVLPITKLGKSVNQVSDPFLFFQQQHNGCLAGWLRSYPPRLNFWLNLNPILDTRISFVHLLLRPSRSYYPP